MLALRVTGVRWRAGNETALALLGADESQRPGIIAHDCGLELARYHVDALDEAGWDIGDYE